MSDKHRSPFAKGERLAFAAGSYDPEADGEDINYEIETESMAETIMDVASKRDYYIDLLPERTRR